MLKDKHSAFLRLEKVIGAIKEKEGLKDETLVLFIQLDEYQDALYTTLCMLCSISDFISKICTDQVVAKCKPELQKIDDKLEDLWHG